MTERNQTPNRWTKDDDTEGHGHRGTDDHAKDDDTEGHGHRGTDDHAKDDDTEGHIHWH